MTEYEHRRCEKCGVRPKGLQFLDYCAVCSADLCDKCMAEGHCGNIPAASGSEADEMIDLSDIPEAGEEFFKKAKLKLPEGESK